MPGITRAHGRREANDKFYSRPEIVAMCLSQIDVDSYDWVIEPSAGAGAFSRPLLDRVGIKLDAFDVMPESPEIQYQNWFDVGPRDGRGLVVGNPPFGVKYHLATRFINHAFERVGAQTVAFILPRSFRKESVQRLLFPHAHLTHETLLPDPAFTLRGDPHKVPVVFQVWERMSASRPVAQQIDTEHVRFVKHHEDWDFAVFRVGGRAGKAVLPGERHVGVYNYFLQNLTNIPHELVVKGINDEVFGGLDDCVGPKSLPKPHLVAAINRVFSTHLMGG